VRGRTGQALRAVAESWIAHDAERPQWERGVRVREARRPVLERGCGDFGQSVLRQEDACGRLRKRGRGALSLRHESERGARAIGYAGEQIGRAIECSSSRGRNDGQPGDSHAPERAL
jgi:hypothetical protein